MSAGRQPQAIVIIADIIDVQAAFAASLGADTPGLTVVAGGFDGGINNFARGIQDEAGGFVDKGRLPGIEIGHNIIIEYPGSRCV